MLAPGPVAWKFPSLWAGQFPGAMGLLKALLLAAPLCPRLVVGKDAFVFLGATGDNALRPNGVWQGVFEAFAGGEFDKVGGLEMHVAMNTPHTVDELRTKVN